MPKDRDQQTPLEPDDRERLERQRGSGRAGTGLDLLPGEPGGPPQHRIEVTSAAFEPGDRIPERYGHDAENISPPLEWSDVPENAAELALLCEDPDAPQGTFVHWVLAGLPPSVTGIAEGVGTPGQAIAGVNDFGEQGWGGPAPPPGHGPHRYVFTVFAASESLDLEPGCTARDLHDALAGRELARGELIGTFER